MKDLVFVSSVQDDLEDIRARVRDYIQGDPMLGRYFEVFLFEDQPAEDQRPDQLYIDRVDACAVYIGLFANNYGWGDPADGVSPTEGEFDRATERRKERLIFVRRGPCEARHPKMQALIAKAERQVKRQSFSDTGDLTGQIQASLIRYLERRGILAQRPFAADVCPDAGLPDIDVARVIGFLYKARARRDFGYRLADDTEAVLTHLNLLEGRRPLRSAVLLFGADPQPYGDAGLPEPDFRQDGDQFVATVWRDWLTVELLDRLALNERQRKVMAQVRRERRITTAAYVELTDISPATAKRDLEGLVALGLIEPCGSHYLVPRKRLGLDPKSDHLPSFRQDAGIQCHGR